MRHVAGTTPYPWPFDGDLAAPATALLIVVPAGSDLRVDGGVIERIGLLAGAVAEAGGAVVLAATVPPVRPGRLRPASPVAGAARVGGGTAAPGSSGHEMAGHAPVAGPPPDLVVTARGLDAFFGSGLDTALRARGIERLLLAGAGLETAVHSTMRDANDRGYECLLVVDACTAVDPALVPAAVSMVEMSGGIFGAVGRTAEVLAALGSHAPTEPAGPIPVPDHEGAPR
jgi:nicotinamidase-related amidase